MAGVGTIETGFCGLGQALLLPSSRRNYRLPVMGESGMKDARVGGVDDCLVGLPRFVSVVASPKVMFVKG